MTRVGKERVRNEGDWETGKRLECRLRASHKFLQRIRQGILLGELLRETLEVSQNVSRRILRDS